jgi:hypothetical protein
MLLVSLVLLLEPEAKQQARNQKVESGSVWPSHKLWAGERRGLVARGGAVAVWPCSVQVQVQLARARGWARRGTGHGGGWLLRH